MKYFLFSLSLCLSLLHASDHIKDEEIPSSLKADLQPVLHRAYRFESDIRASTYQLIHYSDTLNSDYGRVLQLKRKEILNDRLNNVVFFKKTISLLKRIADVISTRLETSKRF